MRRDRLSNTASGMVPLGLSLAIFLVSLIPLILWWQCRRVTNYLVSSTRGSLSRLHVILIRSLKLRIKLPILVQLNQIHQVFIGDGRQSKLEVLVSKIAIYSPISSSDVWTLCSLIILLLISSLIICLVLLGGSQQKQVSLGQRGLFKGRDLV